MQKGFTLIEILVVIVIIAIMSGTVAINIGAPTYGRFKSGVFKFQTLLSALNDEAIYSGSVILCDFHVNSIHCQRYRDEEKTPINLHQAADWTWPDDFTVQRVMVNGVKAKSNQVKFLPSGENEPLSIQVSNGVYDSWLDSSLTGEFSVSS